MSSPDPHETDASTPPAASPSSEASTEDQGFPKRATRFAYFYAGIFTPLVCFLATAAIGHPAGDTWQSGNFDVYASLMLTARAGWPFYPLLLYCMVAIGCYAVREEPADERFWVRLGLYGGAILAWQYVFLVYFAGSLNSVSRDLPFVLVCLMVMIPIATGLGIILSLLGGLLLELAETIGWLKSIAACGLPALLLVALIAAGDFASMEPVLACTILFVGVPGPIFAALAFSLAAYQVAVAPGRYRFRISHLLAGTGWAAAHLAAWRKSMDLAIEAYNKLPTDPPQCYVCTAAVRGHARFVGSRPVAAPDGRIASVNDQLQTLKAAELALAIATPRFHRRLRRLYNHIGPPIARRLRNPWLADAAYVSLKPAEWLARFVLRRVLRVEAARIRQLYESAP
jgi:hypothetical protein